MDMILHLCIDAIDDIDELVLDGSTCICGYIDRIRRRRRRRRRAQL